MVVIIPYLKDSLDPLSPLLWVLLGPPMPTEEPCAPNLHPLKPFLSLCGLEAPRGGLQPEAAQWPSWTRCRQAESWRGAEQQLQADPTGIILP